MSEPITRLNEALAGRYRIERELGVGGTATVYLADDLRHGRKVALKVLRPELAAAVGAERFLAEIRTTANLQHPHVLPLFDSGEADSFLFYIMPYVEGESLRERIDREHQLPVGEAVAIATSVAEALDYAHRRGVVHRDIKPANILLQDGAPVVSDFGIALAVGAAGGGRLTETGLSLGTPRYMAPEQATGEGSVGPAADVWALGCVLYEMLAGEPPYTGRTPQAILGRIIRGAPDPVTEHRRSVPPHVAAAIERALEGVPADRFGTAGELARALADPTFRHRAPRGARVTGGTSRASAAAGWIVAAVLALAIGAWAALPSPSPTPEIARHVLATEGWAGTDAPLGHLAAISPDGSSLVLPVGTWPADYRLGIKPRSSTEIAPLPGTEGAQDVVFSPDGRSIAYVRRTALIRTPLSGGPPITLADDLDEFAAAIAWLDDGTVLYEQVVGGVGFVSPSRIVRIPESGGTPIQTFESSGGGAAFPIWLAALPGARGALVVGCAGAPVTCTAEGADLYVLDLEDGSVEAIVQEVMRAWYVERTGHLVYARPDGRVFAVPFDLGSLRPRGSSVLILEGVRVGANHVDMVLGPEGTVLYVEGQTTAFGLSEPVWVDRSGREQPLDPDLSAMGFTTLALSPDDGRLAVTIETPRASGIWIKELPDGPLTRAHEHGAAVRWPVWSADGSTVTYITNTGGRPHVRRVRSDGGSVGEPDIVLRRELPVLQAIYTRRGLIFLEDSPTGGAALGLFDLAAGAVTEEPRPTGLNERALDLSHDGGWLAFTSDITGRSEVYVRRVPDNGGRTQVSINGGTAPLWAHNGRELFYREPGSGMLLAATYTTDPEFRVQSRAQLFDASPYVVQWGHKTYDVTGDDGRFVMMKTARSAARLVLIEHWFEELRERGRD